MKRLLVAVCIAMLALCGLAFPCSAQETGSLKVTVIDLQGAVITRAEVRVGSEQEPGTATDSLGVALIEGLAPGKYAVTVKARGFKDGSAPEVLVVAGHKQETTVKLSPDPEVIQIYQTLDADTFSGFLKAMEEPNLCSAPIPEHVHSYRFLWAPTFDNPVLTHVVIEANGTATLRVKILSGAGGYELGKIKRNTTRNLSLEEQNTLFSTLADIGFWQLPARVDNSYEIILDGTSWAIEGIRDGKCHAVARYESPLTAVFSEYFLKGVAKVEPFSKGAK